MATRMLSDTLPFYAVEGKYPFLLLMQLSRALWRCSAKALSRKVDTRKTVKAKVQILGTDIRAHRLT